MSKNVLGKSVAYMGKKIYIKYLSMTYLMLKSRHGKLCMRGIFQVSISEGSFCISSSCLSFIHNERTLIADAFLLRLDNFSAFVVVKQKARKVASALEKCKGL